MAVRRAHLVGSIPAATAGEAMRLAVQRLGPDLDALPDGETGERRNWVISMIERFREHPDLRLAKQGDWSDYDKTPRFALRPGHRLYGAALDLGISAAARAAMPEFDTLRATMDQTSPGRPRFQVGIPGDVDLALFTFGPSGPVRHLRPFTEALAIVLHQTSKLYGDDVLFQIEVPVELVLLARAPSRLRPALAVLLARRIAALAQGAPEGARFGIHLCLGDMNHQALGRISDASPLVLLANAVVNRWPARRPLEYVHAPLAAADNPPPDQAAFYAPLAGLELGPDVRFIAGFAHEDQDVATQFRIRDMIEAAVGHPVDISTSCGLGRRELDSALAAMDRIKLLISGRPA
ncbi:MAG: hypothetical protein M3Z75_11300 [Actinomycetota bacterium]|nr:hypothetical protein [Actinomycetota bacterium]